MSDQGRSIKSMTEVSIEEREKAKDEAFKIFIKTTVDGRQGKAYLDGFDAGWNAHAQRDEVDGLKDERGGVSPPVCGNCGFEPYDPRIFDECGGVRLDLLKGEK